MAKTTDKAITKTSGKVPTKRVPIRFKPDPLTIAYLDFSNTKEFSPTCTGIVINESYSGCSVVVSTDKELTRGDKLRVKIGQLSDMAASIAWVKVLEENILKLGIQLLE